MEDVLWQLLAFLGWVVSLLLSLMWSVAWFVISDLLSTLLWMGLAIYIAFVLRYRSFFTGFHQMVRQALRLGRWGWRWLLGSPPALSTPVEIMPASRRRSISFIERLIWIALVLLFSGLWLSVQYPQMFR